MHELSLCGAIADIATRKSGGRSIAAIHIRIGQLRQVVPDTLVFCWELVTAESTLAGSVLAVERVPATLSCRTCATTAPLGDSIALACQSCGSLDVEVLSGEEFDVTALDLVSV